MTTPDPRCGSYAGWNRHQTLREEACEPCKQAQRDYMKDYRKGKPALAEYYRRYSGARGRALSRLAKKYPDEYKQLFAEERRRK